MRPLLCCCRATRRAARCWGTQPRAEAKAPVASAGTSACCEWRACNHTMLAREHGRHSEVRAARGIGARLRQAVAQTRGCGGRARVCSAGRKATHSSVSWGLPALTQRCFSASKAAASVWPLKQARGGAAASAPTRQAGEAAGNAREAGAHGVGALAAHPHLPAGARGGVRRRAAQDASARARASDMPLPRTQSAYAFCSSLHFFSARFFIRWMSAAARMRGRHRQLHTAAHSHAAAMSHAERTHPPPLS